MNPMKKTRMPKEMGMSPPQEEVKAMKPHGMPNFMSRAKRPGGMAKGGKVAHPDAAQDRKLIRSEFKKLEKKEDGMKKGGLAKTMKPKGFPKMKGFK